jgi:signal transduction histidine kinase
LSAHRSAVALAAIVAPAAIVAVLGWVSLRQWEASAEALFREQARDMAAMAVEKVEMTLRHEEDALLERLRDALGAGAAAPALETLVHGAPLVDRLYVLDRHGRALYPPVTGPEDAGVLSALSAETAGGFWERGGRRELRVGDRLLVAVILATPGGAPVLVACTRDLEALRRLVLETTLGTLESPTILAVLDHAGRPVYSRAPLDDAERLTAIAFRTGLPAWQLAVYQPPGTSPRQAVRRQVALFTGAFAVLLAVIAAAAVATWRLVRRESEMARLKAEFVGNVSHDLKTPLAVIRMYSETLEMGRVPEEARRQNYFRVIARESERLSHLIDNVLDFSRIESGRQRYDTAPTALEPLVREALDAFAHPLEQQGFKVEVDVPADLPEVEADAGAVVQALGNLVDNAIKYSAGDRSLTVRARVEGGGVAVTVADRGIGIPAAEHARIFEKFYRVGRSETQGRRGSGVGLALVRHIAEAHGGRVTVESAAGEGSRFTLWLPRAGGTDG